MANLDRNCSIANDFLSSFLLPFSRLYNLRHPDDHDARQPRGLYHRHNPALSGHYQPVYRNPQDHGEGQQEINVKKKNANRRGNLEQKIVRQRMLCTCKIKTNKLG